MSSNKPSDMNTSTSTSRAGSHNTTASGNATSSAYTQIPASAKKLIQNLKEIVRNHSEEEIYATLKETNMDPDDALHKLMNQDTFHEVKRKRDKRKESASKVEPVEAKKKLISGSTLTGRLPSQIQSRSNISKPTNIDGNSNNRRPNFRDDGNHQMIKAVSQTENHQNLNGSRTGSAVPLGASGTNRRIYRNRVSQVTRKSWTRISSSRVIKADGSQEGVDLSRKQIHSTESSSANQKKTTSNVPGTRLFFGYHKSRASFQPQQQTGSRKRAPPGLEWKRKSVSIVEHQGPFETSSAAGVEVAGDSHSLLSKSGANEVANEATPDSQKLKFQDDPPVIIPEHLKVPESESAGLNFGSFNTEFEVEFATRLKLDNTNNVSVDETLVNSESVTEEPVEASASERSNAVTSSSSNEIPSSTSESFVTSNDAVLSSTTSIVRSSEISKPEHATQQGRQVSIMSTEPGYQAIMPQLHYVAGDSQLQESSRLPNFVQPFTDPASNYFNPVFRPGSESDMRYPFLSTNGSSKFSGNAPLMNGQSISSSQEVSQNSGASQTTLAMGQPSIPVHAYAAQPAGVTISPYATNIYGYQYLPPNYAYMHSPYQSGYSANTGYPQPPVGSNFASGARGYPPVGTATVKYPPPQYKLGSGNPPPHALVATGYGAFATNPSAFAAINTNATAGNTSSYEDMPGSQFKENSLYTSTHQVEGSTVWVQAPLSRDGVQSNSYYNVHNQAQHTGYSHSQPTHVHPGAGFAAYNQAAPSPNNHQMIQQPHAIGSVGIGSQAVIFPPHQRGQVNWNNNYSNLIRNQ